MKTKAAPLRQERGAVRHRWRVSERQWRQRPSPKLRAACSGLASGGSCAAFYEMSSLLRAAAPPPPQLKRGIVTINVPVVYMGRYEVVLRGYYP
jgi:hypothetical protein